MKNVYLFFLTFLFVSVTYFTHSRTVSFAGFFIQNDLSAARLAIDSGKDLGLKYLNNSDTKSRNRSKSHFNSAEKILRKALRKDGFCQDCFEMLAELYFYEAYFKYSKNYDDCIDIVNHGLDNFPESSTLYFYQGYAYYNSQQYAEACKTLNYYLVMGPDNPDIETQVREVLNDAQQRFLKGWNKQSDFYNSNEAHIYTYNQQTNQFQDLFHVTPQWELNSGNQAHSHLAGQYNRVNDPELQAYLDGLISRLVSRTPGPYLNYKVTVLDSPEINAVTPPGYVIIYTGLLRFVDTEAQLAGVLAHELAHNYAHHSARRYIAAYHTNNLANSIYQSIDPKNDWTKLSAKIGAQIVQDLFLKAYSRDKEKEADLYGTHLLFNAGYNPTALSEFFLKLYKLNPKQPLKFLSTHPPSPDRINYITDYLESFPLDRETKVSTEAFERIKGRYASMESKKENTDHRILPPDIKN